MTAPKLVVRHGCRIAAKKSLTKERNSNSTAQIVNTFLIFSQSHKIYVFSHR